MELYLITLSGMGDTMRKLVDRETFDWVCDGGEPPAEQLKLLGEDRDLSIDDDDVRDHSNDRAIAVYPSRINGAYYEDDGGSTKALLAFCNEHDVELGEDEYEGYLY